MKTFRKGGIHPPQMKLTAGDPIRDIPLPGKVSLLMSQNIGKPSKPLVAKGDRVVTGQLIAAAGGFMGAPVHSPVDGTVSLVGPVRDASGMWRDGVVIDVDSEQAPPGFVSLSETEVDDLKPSEIIRKIADAGIVGLGGAAFPTRVKLTIPLGKRVSELLINGAECEPYLTCDDALMRSVPEKIIKGALLIKRAVGAERCLVGIESNKPEAIDAMRRASAGEPDIEVVRLRTKFPQGGERQLIKALTGKTVPAGELPLSVECVVDNVATAYAVYEAIYEGKPLIYRIMSVSGNRFEGGGNLRVRIGTPVSHILSCSGIDMEEIGKIVSGGPMTGQALPSLETPMVKSMGGLTLFSGKKVERRKIEPCIRCARCVEVCPSGLEPYLFMIYGQRELWEEMSIHNVSDCISCGSCSYVCPSSRPLLDYIKLGKSVLKRLKK